MRTYRQSLFYRVLINTCTTILLSLCINFSNAQLTPGISVNGNVLANGSTIKVCRNSSVTFTSTAQYTTSIFWRFQNGSPATSSSTTPVVTYNTAGTWPAWQIITSGVGKDSMVVFVEVTTVKPTADFSFAPNNVCGNIPINFTNLSTGNGLSYQWTFEPGVSSTLQNPSYQFLNAIGSGGTQIYNVNLLVTNDQNCTEIITKPVTVNRIPDAKLGRGNASVVEKPFDGYTAFTRCENIPNFSFPFANTSTTTGINTSYTIKWGDGAPDSTFSSWPTGTLIYHTYPLGQYELTISVTGSTGCIGIKKYLVFLGGNPSAGLIKPAGTDNACAPQSFFFPISDGTVPNPPGTIYKISVNDGSPLVTYQFPPPAGYTHLFSKSSCGTNSSDGSMTFQNAFRVNLTVSNPCGVSAANVIPINVSGKPKAAQTIPQTTCVNNNTSISNTSNYGSFISASTGQCLNSGNQVWEISPPTYTVTGGSLGSLNGQPNNSIVWTNGSLNINVRFNQTGTYAVKLYISNESCGSDTITKFICVRNEPTATFTMDKKFGCEADSAIFTTTTSAASCFGDSYSWTVTYQDPINCFGTAGTFAFIGGTSAASKDPKIKFNNPGRYIIQLQVSAIGSGACTPVVLRDTFFVLGKPKVTINPISAICAGNSISPVAQVNNCYAATPPVYLWTFNNGSPPTATTLVPGSVTYTTFGTQPISLAVTNECGTTTANTTVNVTNPPVSNAGPDTTICSGTPVVIGTASTGFTYSWSPATGLSNANAARPTATINYTGTNNDSTYQYIITVSAGATCFSKDTVLITVKRKPVLLTNPLSAAICTGGSATLTVAGASTYTWSPATGLNITTGDTVISTPAGNVSYIVTGTLSNGCTATATIPVTVTTSPVANAGRDTSICSGASVFVGVNVGTGFTYSWSPATFLSNPGIARPSATLTYNGPSNDTTYQYVVTVSAGASCTSKDTVLLTVKRTPFVTVSPNAVQICSGTGATLTAAGADTYVWSPATGLSATTGSVVTASPSSNINYSIIGTLANGCTGSAVANVTVTIAPVVNAGRDSTMCTSSSAIQFTGTPSGGTWGGSTFVTPGGVFNPGAAGIGIYKIYYTAGPAACRRSDTLVATVIDAPVANAGNDSTLCQSSTTIQLSASPAGGTWSGSSFITGSGVFTPSTSGTYTLIYSFGSGSCFAKDTTIFTVNAGITNNTITPNQAICLGSPAAIIIGSVTAGGNGTSLYQWQVSSDSLNWSNIAGATQKDYTPPAVTTTIFYRRIVSTTLCSGTQSNVSLPVKIIINPDARALFTPTKTRGCIPFIITPAIINLTPFNAAVNEYRWYVNGLYIGSGQNFPGYTMSNTGDSITIKLIAISRFGCKNDSMQRGFVTVARPLPAFSQSDSVGCGPLNISFTNNTPNAARYSYQWDFGNGQTSTLQQPAAITFATNPLSGDTTYTIKFTTLSECDTIVLTRFVRVKSKPKALFTPDKTTSCSGYNFTFSNTSRGLNATYVWDFGDGSPLLATNAPQVNHVYRVGTADTFRVKLKATNECGADSLIYNLVVTPITIRLDFAINGNQRFGCAPHLVQFINNSIGGTIYNWDFGDGTSLTTSKSIDTIPHIYTLPGNYTIRLRGTNNCSDTTDTELVTVNIKPAVSFTASPIVACVGDTIRYTNLSDTGIIYNWRFGDGTTSAFKNPVKIFNAAGTYRTWLTGSRIFATGGSCSDSAFTDILIRDSLPGIITASDTITGCSPAVITFKNGNRPSAGSTWNFGDGSTGTGDSVVHTYNLPGVYIVKMFSRGLAGCNYVATKTIVVNGLSGVLRYNGGYVCLGDAKQFEVIGTGASHYRFVFGDGDSVTVNGNIVSHVYTRPGTYIPYAWLLSGNCALKVITGDTIKVDRIKAGFRTTIAQVCGASTVAFADTSNAFFGVRTWQWNFGDGTFSSLQNPFKTYTQTGVYNVRLRITGIIGCIDSILIPITVNVRTRPISTITGDSTACIQQPISLSALVQSQDAIAAYDWNFGNGNTASGATVTATYNAPGTFLVRLITRTTFGCADTVYKTVRVNAVPQINAGNDVTICLGQSVQLNASGANNWQWSPLQGLSCNTCSNPIANPTFTTIYVATGSNSLLCRATDSVTVTVMRPFNITVTGSDSICIGQTSQLFATGGFKYVWNPSISLDRADVPNPIATPLSITFYRVIGFDQFNCFSDTGFVRVAVGQYPTVDLGTGGIVVAGTNINLNAIVTGGPIASYRWTPTRDLSCTNCGNPVATINTNILYKLEVENFYGCTASDTISFRVNCDASQVFIPNAFSPDGDGINDILMVRAKGVAQVKYFRVFNRWGQLVFERSNINANDPLQGWNGKVNGAQANPDVYVYTAEAICTAGGTFIYKGNVTLVR